MERGVAGERGGGDLNIYKHSFGCMGVTHKWYFNNSNYSKMGIGS